MLGCLILYSLGLRLLGFQLFSFYYNPTTTSSVFINYRVLGCMDEGNGEGFSGSGCFRGQRPKTEALNLWLYREILGWTRTASFGELRVTCLASLGFKGCFQPQLIYSWLDFLKGSGDLVRRMLSKETTDITWL